MWRSGWKWVRFVVGERQLCHWERWQSGRRTGRSCPVDRLRGADRMGSASAEAYADGYWRILTLCWGWKGNAKWSIAITWGMSIADLWLKDRLFPLARRSCGATGFQVPPRRTRTIFSGHEVRLSFAGGGVEATSGEQSQFDIRRDGGSAHRVRIDRRPAERESMGGDVDQQQLEHPGDHRERLPWSHHQGGAARQFSGSPACRVYFKLWEEERPWVEHVGVQRHTGGQSVRLQSRPLLRQVSQKREPMGMQGYLDLALASYTALSY